MAANVLGIDFRSTDKCLEDRYNFVLSVDHYSILPGSEFIRGDSNRSPMIWKRE